jgi:hypothetical protein
VNLKAVKNAITSKFGNQVLHGKKHAPAILFGAGVIGVVTATVLACKATLKMEEVLDEIHSDLDKARSLEHANYSETDRQKDIALIYLKGSGRIFRMYAPAIGIGVLSIFALTGSHVMLTKRNAAAVAAYAALDKGFREYRDRVMNELGADKDREFRYGKSVKTIVEETEQGPVTKDITVYGDDTPSIYARVFDDSCPMWQKQPEYNRLFLKCQQNYANDMLNARGHLFLNEVYAMLGMKHSSAGAVVGWLKGDGDGFIDFGIFTNLHSHQTRDFVNGWNDRVLLDFNVDGIIYDKI